MNFESSIEIIIVIPFCSIDIILKKLLFNYLLSLRIRRIGFKNQSWEYISRLIIVIIRTYKILEIKF